VTEAPPGVNAPAAGDGSQRSGGIRRSRAAETGSGPNGSDASSRRSDQDGSGRLPKGRRGLRYSRLATLFAVMGPGIIAANAGNDAAGIATYSSSGSQFIYRTLFFMVLVTVALVMVQEMAVRLGAHTGKGLGALIREQFSLRMSAVALFCLLLANTGLVVSEFAGIGAALGLFGISKFIVIPLAAIGLWALVLFGSYRYAERAFLFLSLAFFAYPIAALLGHPDWKTVGANTVLPHFVFSQPFLLLGVALIGTTVSPYMQFYAAAGVVDRGVGPDDYKLARIDAISGALFACLVSMAIIVATGASIGGSGPLQSAKQAAEALRPVAGSQAVTLFAIGLLGASALAAAVVPLSGSYAVSEAVGVERSVSRKFSEAPVFLGLFTAQIILGAAVALTPVNVISLLIGTQVLQGLISPIVLVFILILANRRSVLGAAANKKVFKIAATIAVVAVAAMSASLLMFTVLGWFGIA
jgi:Mn2+/Fe2+ NRAMP family transporter